MVSIVFIEERTQETKVGLSCAAGPAVAPARGQAEARDMGRRRV